MIIDDTMIYYPSNKRKKYKLINTVIGFSAKNSTRVLQIIIILNILHNHTLYRFIFILSVDIVSTKIQNVNVVCNTYYSGLYLEYEIFQTDALKLNSLFLQYMKEDIINT